MSHTIPLFDTGRGDWRPTRDDHYTPGWVFETMGLEFDLDVAAPPGGIPWIPAKRYFTISDDGLAQEWDGLVWCNPPFSKITPWAEKWCSHTDGVFLAAISKSAWLAKVCAAADVLWIPPQGIDFVDPDDQPTSVFIATFIAGRGSGAAGVERLGDALGGSLMHPVSVCEEPQ